MPQLVASSVPSPCRNICKVARGICMGCGRTLDEISAWPTAPDSERRAIVARAGDRIREPAVKRGLGAAGGSR